MKDLHKKVARDFVKRKKTAGEVRFIKDNSGDASQWAFANNGPSERLIGSHFVFNKRSIKTLAQCMQSTTAALGHVMSAYTKFAKLKSADISPDGSLGGKGYIQKISDMRRQYMNVVEALSALSDTLYDEIRAPHWAQITRANEEVSEIVEKAEEIKQDPEDWAKKQEAK